MKKIITSIMLLITVLGTLNANAQCGTPAGLNAAYVAPSMNLTWTAVTGANSYAINIQNASGNNVFFNATFNSNTNSFSIGGLTLNANYKFKVRSRCAGGHGSWSPYFNFVFGGTGTGTGCGVVSGVTIASTTASGGTFTWNAVQGASGYRVRIENGSGNPIAFANVATVAGTTYTKGGLQSSTNYKVKVRAMCGGNLGGWSAWVPFTTNALRLDGSADELAKAEIQLAPNPSVYETRISYTGPVEEAMFTVSVFDLTGRVVFTDQFSTEADDYVLTTSSLQDGQYILTVKNGSYSANQRLVVRH